MRSGCTTGVFLFLFFSLRGGCVSALRSGGGEVWRHTVSCIHGHGRGWESVLLRQGG